MQNRIDCVEDTIASAQLREVSIIYLIADEAECRRNLLATAGTSTAPTSLGDILIDVGAHF